MRPACEDERAQLERALERWGKGLLEPWIRPAQLWVREAPPALEFYALDAQIAADLAQTEARRAARSAGLPLARLSRGRLELLLEGAFELGRRTQASRVHVNDKAAGLFLYGKTVLGESVASIDPSARPGDVVLVANPRGEVLGTARLVQPLPARGPALEPLLDRGWYLRKGG